MFRSHHWRCSGDSPGELRRLGPWNPPRSNRAGRWKLSLSRCSTAPSMAHCDATMDDELLTNVETLKNILVSRATGGMPEETEFRALRMELMQNARIAKLLPQFVRS